MTRLRRRTFLAGTASLALGRAADVEREVFIKSPGKGTAVMAMAFYTERSGGAMKSIEERWTRSDTIDAAYYRRSADHGRTWSQPEERRTGEKTPRGMLRRHLRGGWVDPRTGRLIEFWNEGVLPSDDPLEGLRQWQIYYRIGDDATVHQAIHRGAGYTPDHSFPGVRRGENSVMLGDHTCQPIGLSDGAILLPVAITLARDGKLYNPGGGYTYHDAAVLIGRWRGQKIEWEISERVEGDPARTTRGVIEPTLGRLTRGRLIMVLRGSNDRKPELPSHRWVSLSSDGGRRWTRPVPWTYHDGAPFYSPSACSQLVHHSNGRLYWLGNITPENPRGNRPRYPFIIGEVDQDTGKLIRDSVRTVDDRQPGEDELLTLSNFYAREDRASGGVALHMTRMFAFADGWEGDAFLYRIGVGS